MNMVLTDLKDDDESESSRQNGPEFSGELVWRVRPWRVPIIFIPMDSVNIMNIIYTVTLYTIVQNKPSTCRRPRGIPGAEAPWVQCQAGSD